MWRRKRKRAKRWRARNWETHKRTERLMKMRERWKNRDMRHRETHGERDRGFGDEMETVCEKRIESISVKEISTMMVKQPWKKSEMKTGVETGVI